MRLLICFAASISALLTSAAAQSNLSSPLSSHIILPDSFKPPELFKNVKILRNINLEKGYIKVTINAVIENIDAKPQAEYYIPFKAELISKIGGLEVRDKKDPAKPPFKVETAQYDPFRSVASHHMPPTTRKLKFGSIVQFNSFVSLCPLPWQHHPKNLSP